MRIILDKSDLNLLITDFANVPPSFEFKVEKIEGGTVFCKLSAGGTIIKPAISIKVYNLRMIGKELSADLVFKPALNKVLKLLPFSVSEIHGLDLEEGKFRRELEFKELDMFTRIRFQGGNDQLVIDLSLD